MARAGKDGRFPRRTLLLTASGLVAGGALGSFARSPAENNGEAQASWEQVRKEFELDGSFIHLSSMFIATHPRRVAEAIARHRAGLQANPTRYVLENDARLRLEVVSEAAAFWGAQKENVALTGSTTEALSVLYNGLKLDEGDEIILEDQAYYSTVEALSYKARHSGARLRSVKIHDDPSEASADEMVDRLMDAVGPRTRAMALTWVHSDTGVKLPISRIAERLAALNRSRSPTERVLLCVDGVHGLGVEDVQLGDLGCDFFAAGTHKWMFGPRGTGVLIASDSELWERVIPTIPAFGVQITPGLIMSPGGFHAFEHRWALADAFRFIGEVGIRRIAERTRQHATFLKEALLELPRVRVLTPSSPELSSGIVAFTMAGMSAESIAERMLAKEVVVAPSSYGVSSVRMTPAFFNTQAELATAVRALRDIA